MTNNFMVKNEWFEVAGRNNIVSMPEPSALQYKVKQSFVLGGIPFRSGQILTGRLSKIPRLEAGQIVYDGEDALRTIIPEYQMVKFVPIRLLDKMQLNPSFSNNNTSHTGIFSR